jgi:hypothetical protein
MAGGDRVSAREKERERGREGERACAGRPRGWTALLGHAGAGALQWVVRLGRARGRKESRPERKVLFFFFKNVNSVSICLFCLNFCRAPKLVKFFV